ncbi:MAG: response regulator transcription factor [Bacteroidaceae bacterium]|nr:response regulator transcription factor [Bacteroidaceae bacterium]MCF0186533.1 response regulator transcription factor [Bacteroidaceae bacterium]
MKLNCIIVDDEPLAIKLMRSFVERTPFMELRGAYLNPMEALAAVNDDIHLVFLDINMPGITGMELSKLIPQPTRIIFTTAYKEFAFESYEVQALDYLLKPISYPKFLKAVTRGKEYFEQMTAAATVMPGVSAPPVENQDYIFVKCEFKQVRVDLDKILFVSGMRDYVRIHMKDQKRPITALSTMKAMEEKLTEPRFMRVHRSFIVALDKIESVERNCISIAGEAIPISEANQEHFFELLK